MPRKVSPFRMQTQREQNYAELVSLLKISPKGIQRGWYDSSRRILEIDGKRMYKVSSSKHKEEIIAIIYEQIERGVIKDGRVRPSKMENNFIVI